MSETKLDDSCDVGV